MVFPNLPTDNLYKFIALSGLIIIFFPTAYYSHQVNELSEKIIDFQLKIDIGEINAKYVGEKIERFIQTVELNAELSSADRKTEETKLVIDSLVKDMRIEKATINAFAEKINKLKVRADKLRFLALFCIIGGPLLTFVGFVMWDIKVQKPMDKVLANNANSPKARRT